MQTYIAKRIQATYVRIDTIEQGLRDLCDFKVEGEGYRLSYKVVTDNLKVGNNVIADSVNPWELTRKEWNEVAESVGAEYKNIEVICSDQGEHRRRVENRKVGVQNLKLPTWEEVINRDYKDWTMPRIVIDTAGKSIEESTEQIVKNLT